MLWGLSASADLGLENIYFCSLATFVTAVGVEGGEWDLGIVTALLSSLLTIRTALAGVGLKPLPAQAGEELVQPGGRTGPGAVGNRHQSQSKTARAKR